MEQKIHDELLLGDFYSLVENFKELLQIELGKVAMGKPARFDLVLKDSLASFISFLAIFVSSL